MHGLPERVELEGKVEGAGRVDVGKLRSCRLAIIVVTYVTVPYLISSPHLGGRAAFFT